MTSECCYILQFTFLLLGTSPKEQIISEPQSKKEHPQQNDRHTNRWSTEDVLVWVLVGVVCLGLVGGGVYWIYSNQGEGKVAVLCEFLAADCTRMGNIVCLLSKQACE